MDDKLRIILVMSAVLVLLMIGFYKKQKQDSLEPIEKSIIKDKPESVPLEDEIYYGYYLVSGSFLIWKNAEDQYNTLTDFGYECKILPVTDGHGYYRVVLFWSDTYEEVKEYQNNIKSDVPKCWILVK
jgi:cell division protein FtsN